MNAGENDHEFSEVSEAEARAELKWLLSDKRFQATNRGRSVLAYIAGRYFEGHTDGVKAYAIALDVLGRSHRFDPNSDPIVRIELSRLRSALDTYYQTYGAQREISIELPIGRYVTIFHRDREKPAIEEGAEEDAKDMAAAGSPSLVAPLAAPKMGRKSMVISSSVIGLGALVAVAWWATKPTDMLTERPRVSLEVEAADTTLEDEADLLQDHLLTALSRFRTMTVTYQEGQASGSTGAVLAQNHRHSYSIELKYYASNSDRSVWWQALDTGNGAVLASGTKSVPVGGRSEDAIRQELVSLLAREFGPSRGVISNLETHEEPGRTVLGNTCVLRAEFELNNGSQSGVQMAKECLERTLRYEPGSSDAAAVLARVLIDTENSAVPVANLDRADALARQAVALDPMSDRAHIALMMVQFYRGNAGAAISAGNQAFALNPNNPEVLSKLAFVLYTSGYRQGALSLAEDASRNVTTAPRDARLVLALNAYREGEFSNASLIAEQISRADAVIMALRAAALGEIGSPTAAERLDELAELMPDYETDLMPLMSRRRFDPAFAISLQKGLHKAKAIAAEPARFN